MADGLAISSALPLMERRAHLGSAERHRVPPAFGAMTAERLTGILHGLQRGEVDTWAELVQFALKDDLLVHLYTTRIARVAQADYQVVPNKFGNQRLARLAAEFVNEMIGRVENWDQFIRNMLHAIALGFSANEIEWDHDGLSRVTYARNIHFVNPNRFRYDDQWKLRLYDHGSRCAAARSMYGEALWPPSWVIHHHYEVAGEPCNAGLMLMSIWRWLFRRWADTFWIQNLEKYGAPFIHAQVDAATPDAVRQKIRENLIDLSIDRAAIVEAGGEIVITPPAMGTGQASQHELYMDFAARSLTATWLGASDVAQPGENGSQAAVSGRISATTDPRMITDGVSLCGSLHRQLFKWLIHYNLHKFGGIPPIPQMQLKTASDEQVTDLQDLAEQNAADTQTGNASAVAPAQGAPAAPYEVRGDPSAPSLESALEPSAPASSSDASTTPSAAAAPASGEVEKKADTALNGAQVSSLLEVINAVVEGRLPRQSAVAIIQVAFNLPLSTAEQVLGAVGQGFVPVPDPAVAAAPPANTPSPAASPPPQSPAEATDPKALSRSNPGRPITQTPKTSQTSSRLIGPLALVLSNMSEDPDR